VRVAEVDQVYAAEDLGRSLRHLLTDFPQPRCVEACRTIGLACADDMIVVSRGSLAHSRLRNLRPRSMPWTLRLPKSKQWNGLKVKYRCTGIQYVHLPPPVLLPVTSRCFRAIIMRLLFGLVRSTLAGVRSGG
jgi:hypothetical protein